MKQLLQEIRSGRTILADVPVPSVRRGQILVHVRCSLVSSGTERMVVDFAEKNLLQKAQSRPDLVRQTLEKAQREGILQTYEAVQNRLEQPMPLGYSLAGTVLEVGEGITHVQAGDHVACAGGGYATHAEIVTVPKNLVVKMPEGVDFAAGAFTTLAAIALQGIRLTEVKLGEVIGVIGLGLLGQLTVQMLKANGCVVIGMDLQADRARLATDSGADFVTTNAEDFADLCRQKTNGHGVDSVLITADTKSNQPIEVAGEVARERAIVVAVGAVGMTIPRKVYYEKELDFRISRSYGPGRYDAEYEEKGHDYPYAYVRWTQQRNMEAYLALVANKQMDIEPLISHRFPIADATKAYAMITGKTGENFLGVVLTYPENADLRRKIELKANDPVVITPEMPASRSTANGHTAAQLKLGVIGAGGFANATLLPAIKDIPNIERVGVASGGGISSQSTADRFDFNYCTTDTGEILKDGNINTVAILTRHHLHARQVLAALNAGKNVFVEKPLCLTMDELQQIVTAKQDPNAPYVMVGFNRRFAPFIVTLKEQLQKINEPLMLNFRTNAGFIPADHWLHDKNQGGGRLLGEGCHFIDLLLFLADQPVTCVTTRTLPDQNKYSQDNLAVTLEFADGSIGNLTYVANGSKAMGKELLEVFGGGMSARMDDYRSLNIQHGKTRIKKNARLRQDKGHQAEWRTLTHYLTGMGKEPMPFADIVRSTTVALAAQESLNHGCPIAIKTTE